MKVNFARFLFSSGLALIVPLLFDGCVTRTTTRARRLGESGGGGLNIDKSGRVVEQETIWIWESKYRQH
jgi:hypothetical protein